MALKRLIQDFADIHRLPSSFVLTAQTDFMPLAESIVQQSASSAKPLLIGINGCQGSGKSTLTEFLLFIFDQHYQIASAGVSIDDFYLTKQARIDLSRTKHPLLETRGVPGTHEITLMAGTLNSLLSGADNMLIPRFNKAIDDRYPQSDWTQVPVRPQIVVFEGWCVGCIAQSSDKLIEPANELEEQEDKAGVWRRFVNQSLAQDYQPIFDRLDRLIMLKAPSFSSVERWREQQEARLRETVEEQGLDGSNVMSPEQIKRFIAHYQRITEHALISLPPKANDLFELDENRGIRDRVIGKGLMF